MARAWSNMMASTAKPKDQIGHVSCPSNLASEALQSATLILEMYRVTQGTSINSSVNARLQGWDGGYFQKGEENGVWSNMADTTPKPKDNIRHTSRPSNWTPEALQGGNVHGGNSIGFL